MKEQSQIYCYYSDLPSPMAYMNLEEEEINTDVTLTDIDIANNYKNDLKRMSLANRLNNTVEKTEASQKNNLKLPASTSRR
jgi:Fe2+ transport system protein B